MLTVDKVERWRDRIICGERGNLDEMDRVFLALCADYIGWRRPRETHRTRRQIEIMKAIEEMTADFKMPPTYQEIANYLGVKSRGNIANNVQALIEKGYLRSIPGRARSIEVIR